MLHQIKAQHLFATAYAAPNKGTTFCLVQHILHQIKAQQFYTNFLVLISQLSQSSVSEVEF